MTTSADSVINYKGITRSTEGYGDISFVFRSENDLVHVLLTNVAHVPDLRYHLFSLPTRIKKGYVFEWRPSLLDSRQSARSHFR